MPPEQVTLFSDDLRALEATTADASPQVEVTIIRPCWSANGLRYSPAVLRQAVSLFEGAAAFADHPNSLDESRAGGRSIRDLVGVYHSARFEEGAGIRATLRFSPAAAWAYDLVRGFIADREAGRPVPPLGISADLLVLKAPHQPNGRRAKKLFDVLSIQSVTSADLVFRPAAGGSFDRLLEAIHTEEGITLPPETTAEPTSPPEDAAAAVAPDSTRTLEAQLAATRQELCAAILDNRLSSSGLPPAAQAAVRERFGARAFEAAELSTEIERTRSLLSAVAPAGFVRGAGAQRHATAQRTPLEQVNIALERMFGLPIADADSHVPKLSGIREAYLVLTGDTDFTGRYNWEKSVAREANEVTTSILDSAVANVMNKRLKADYNGQPKWWEPFVTKTDLRDMKLQTRVLINDFASIPTVSENGAYVNQAWGDTKEEFTPLKKGGLVYVTLETILNDDTAAVRRLPGKLAKAANVTINEYVSALFTTGAGLGPAMADGNTVFNAAHGSNTANPALLADTTLAAAIIVARKHTNSASKVLGITPKFLLVPIDLQWTALTLVNSTLIPGSPNNDINVLKGICTPIVVPNWSDTNNWYLMPDPAESETIEVGFLNGREEPEILVQDTPNAGYTFTNDALVWKVRWIFGAGWLDWRGTYAAINA